MNRQSALTRGAWMAVLCALLFGGAVVPQPARGAETIDFPIYSRTIFFLPLWIADKQGFLKDEGLTVAFHDGATQDQVAAQLKSGALGVNILGPETAFADPSGALRVIAGNAGKLPHFLITQPRIKTLAQLRGANFGVISADEGTTHVIPQIAKAAGLTAADYTMTAVGSAPTRWKLLKAGTIDAGLQPFPLSYEAEDAGFTNLGWTGNWEPEWQFTAVVANATWAQAHRADLVGLLRAMRRGMAFMASHPEESAQVAVTELGTTPAYARRAIADALRLHIMDPGLAVNDAGMRRVFEVSPKAPGVTTYDPARYVDTSYLRESGKSR
jgi:ABC-type nitrate/sulfonate/bicarbonate transport system substrate-binding protein